MFQSCIVWTERFMVFGITLASSARGHQYYFLHIQELVKTLKFQYWELKTALLQVTCNLKNTLNCFSAKTQCTCLACTGVQEDKCQVPLSCKIVYPQFWLQHYPWIVVVMPFTHLWMNLVFQSFTFGDLMMDWKKNP